MKLKVFEAFAGIGTQRMALRNLGIEHEVVAISEIDKFAIKSYEAIHGKVKNLGDITKIKVEEIPDHDLFTYSFPCQDISSAGKLKGLDKNSDTRSSLLWECERIIENKKPKYLLMENVKNLVGKKFKPYFEEWLKVLENLGYSNYWQVLNAKDYGIPQSRERVFCVSILNDGRGYEFPKPKRLSLRLRDILEDEVEERYYLSQEQVDRINLSTYISNQRRIQRKDWCDTLCARDFKDPKCVEVANKVEMIGGIGERNFGGNFRQGNRIYDSNGIATCLTASPVGNAGGYTALYAVDKENDKAEAIRIGGIFDTDKKHQAGSIWDKEGLAPTLDTMQGGWRQPSVIEDVIEIKNDEGIRTFKGGYCRTTRTTNSGGDKRVIIGSTQKNAAINREGVSPTLTSAMGQGGGHVPMHNYSKDLRIRKLTPLECWRLMGCSDEDFYKAESVNSNTQLYKQAGNAIVVDVLEGIFEKLFMPNNTKIKF